MWPMHTMYSKHLCGGQIVAYFNVCKLWFTFRASPSAVAPPNPIRFSARLLKRVVENREFQFHWNNKLLHCVFIPQCFQALVDGHRISQCCGSRISNCIANKTVEVSAQQLEQVLNKWTVNYKTRQVWIWARCLMEWDKFGTALNKLTSIFQ